MSHVVAKQLLNLFISCQSMSFISHFAKQEKMKWDAEWGQYVLGWILKRAVSTRLYWWNIHCPLLSLIMVARKTEGGDHKSHWWQLIYTLAWVTVSVEVGGGPDRSAAAALRLILMLTPTLLSTLPFMRTNWVWSRPALVYSSWSSWVINYQSLCRLWCKHSPVWYWPTTLDPQGDDDTVVL